MFWVRLRPRSIVSSAFVWASLLTFGWALFQNFRHLGTPVALIDEPTYAGAGWRYLHNLVVPLRTAASPQPSQDNFEHPPLAKFLFGLAQVITGRQGFLADRWVAASCTVATAVILAIWIGRAAGRWTGLLAGAVCALVAQPVFTANTVRFGRFGMLDPVAEVFMTASLALAWWWWHSTGRAAWILAAVTGAAAGLATASKENGFLGLVGPVALLLAIAAVRRRHLLIRAMQTVVSGVTCAAVFVGSYAPFDHPLSRLWYIVVYQGAHSARGHLVGYAGRISEYPPWWTNLWYALRGMGGVLVVTLIAASLAALVLRRSLLAVWLLAAVAAPFVFHCFLANVALPPYWVMWMPAVYALSALGISSLVDRVRRGPWLARAASALLALALAVSLAGSFIGESVRVATLRPEGQATLAALRTEHDLHGAVIAAGVYPQEWAPYTKGLAVSYSLPADLTPVDTVVIGTPRCRTLIDRGVRALVTVNRAAGRLREISSDRLVTVYAVVSPLRAPTDADVAHEPPGDLATACN